MALVSLFHDLDRIFTYPFDGVNLKIPFALCVASERTETDKDVTYTYELPGVDKSQLAINVENGFVTINAEKNPSHECPNYTERSYGKFSRTIRLGPRYNVNLTTAKFENGVLEIRVPKTEPDVVGKKIEIQ